MPRTNPRPAVCPHTTGLFWHELDTSPVGGVIRVPVRPDGSLAFDQLPAREYELWQRWREHDTQCEAWDAVSLGGGHLFDIAGLSHELGVNPGPGDRARRPYLFPEGARGASREASPGADALPAPAAPSEPKEAA